jgi:hypothetical protein
MGNLIESRLAEALQPLFVAHTGTQFFASNLAVLVGIDFIEVLRNVLQLAGLGFGLG